jgi:pentatricopeptide repeat protein
MNGWAARGEVSRAEALLSRMEEVGLRPSTFTFNTLMKAYRGKKPLAKADLARVLGLYDRIRSGADGLRPDAYTFSAVMNCLQQAGGAALREKYGLILEDLASAIPPEARSSQLYTAMVRPRDRMKGGGMPRGP